MSDEKLEEMLKTVMNSEIPEDMVNLMNKWRNLGM